MSVRVAKYRGGPEWEVDIRVRLPDGSQYRERRAAPVRSKSAAKRWGEERARHLSIHGPKKTREEVPTLSQFWPRFIENHCRANRHKPSGIESKESSYRNHLKPLFGNKKLDKLCQEDVARLKRRLKERKPATVNNALTTFSQALKCAVEWGVIEAMPVRIKLLKVQNSVPTFYDFDQYSWLVEAAGKIDPRSLLLVLLGGDAGLRRGEVIALEKTDCDLRRGLLTVQRSEWKGEVTETKGMEARVVPMTQRLLQALKDNDHLVGDRVLYSTEMDRVTAKVIQKWMARAQKRAKLKANGGFHLLRHTFCSHLAMRGAPALSIQKLAGHQNMQTTLRYMHLAPGETHRAIALLEDRTLDSQLDESQTNEPPSTENGELGGEIRETGTNVVPFSKHRR